jgi:Kyakuja-Dileera-Zisupton transposase
MHDYAHNRTCQLYHHPKYITGTGIEDFEGCERFFSLSNNCAGITRYTTKFHRLQLLHTHLSDSDFARRLSIGKFIHDNYEESLRRISKLSETFTQLKLEDNVLSGLYTEYLEAEKQHFKSLSTVQPKIKLDLNILKL